VKASEQAFYSSIVTFRAEIMSTSRVFLVTGSNQGIGYEIVKHIAQKDKSYTVYLTSRKEEAGKEAE
jgi:NAD(P)-dependent dehydrogenase (short-subunit alcohol dehydrogenase family)